LTTAINAARSIRRSVILAHSTSARRLRKSPSALLDGWGGPTEQFRPVTDADRRALTDLLLRHHPEAQQFIGAIKARPVQAVRVDLLEARRLGFSNRPNLQLNGPP